MVALGRELFGYKGAVVRQESADKDYIVDNPVAVARSSPKRARSSDTIRRFSSTKGLRRSLIWYSGNREASDA